MQQQQNQFEPMPERMIGMIYTMDNGKLKTTEKGRKKMNIQLHNVKVGGKTRVINLFALEVNGRPGEYAIYRRDFENTDVFSKNQPNQEQ